MASSNDTCTNANLKTVRNGYQSIIVSSNRKKNVKDNRSNRRTSRRNINCTGRVNSNK
jgi:hypothetical protein